MTSEASPPVDRAEVRRLLVAYVTGGRPEAALREHPAQVNRMKAPNATPPAFEDLPAHEVRGGVKDAPADDAGASARAHLAVSAPGATEGPQSPCRVGWGPSPKDCARRTAHDPRAQRAAGSDDRRPSPTPSPADTSRRSCQSRSRLRRGCCRIPLCSREHRGWMQPTPSAPVPSAAPVLRGGGRGQARRPRQSVGHYLVD